MSVQKSVVLGSDALKSPNVVTESVVIGVEAGNKHHNGERNIMIGKAAGFSANGSSNVYIGNGAGHNCQGSGNIVLGSVSDQYMSNTFVVGKQNSCPIIASFETGVVKVPSLIVDGNITYKGSLSGAFHSNAVRVYGMNVGSKCELLKGSNMVCFGENTGYNGNDVVCLGNGAGSGNFSTDVIAIGRNAAYNNNGSNVIAIGPNAGAGNIMSDMLFVGDYIEGDSESLDIRRSIVKGGGCTFNNGNITTTSGIEITPSSLTMNDSKIVTNSTEFMMSKPLVISKPLSSYIERFVFQNEEGVFVNKKKTHSPFKRLFKWKDMFVGLGEDGHVYTSLTAVSWTPIRSPKLTILSYDEKMLYGWDNERFYRYENNEWFPEAREEGDYVCYEMCGPYAFGTHLSNDFYEDAGTILYHAGTEWRLYPGKYPQNFKCISEVEGKVYAGGDNGLYLLEDRKATRVYPKKVTCISKDVAVSESRFHSVHDGKLVWFCEHPIINVNGDLVMTEGGVFFEGKKIDDGKYHFGFIDYGYLPSADLSIPSNIRIGDHVLTSEHGITITDGIQKGKVYDSVFNIYPVRIEGFRSVIIKKCEDGSLVFESVDEEGSITTHKVASLQNSDAR
jgi:hypothetical protein